MAAFYHGVKVNYRATGLVTPVHVESALPVIVGTAPVHNLPEGVERSVNKPVLCHTFSEFVAQFGAPAARENPEDFTLYQAAELYFSRYLCEPLVAINVFDPARHVREVAAGFSGADGPVGEGEVEMPKTTPDVSQVSSEDIIGTVDPETMKPTGLQLVHQIYPLFRLTPGLILAPKYSQDPAVAIAIGSMCEQVGGLFKAMGIIEIAAGLKNYTEAPAWLNDNNLADHNLIAMFGDFSYGGAIESGSAHLAGVIGARDAENDSIPYLKGRIYYYRRRLPKALRDKGWRSEIRVCLRTAYKNLATNIALYLDFATKIVLDRWIMANSSSPDYQNSQAHELDAFLKSEVSHILSQGPKQPLDYAEIEARLNSYLVRCLDANIQSFCFPLAVEDKSIAHKNLSPGEIWEKEATDILKDMNTGNNYSDYCEEAIITALNENIINEDEISQANVEMFVKQFMVMQIKLYKILAARYNGDFGLEKSLIRDEQINISQKTSPQEQPELNVSTLIKRYVSTQMADGSWSKRTVADHKNRITPLLDILGNVNVNNISRNDIRNLRDILKKLPPRWKEKMSKLKCNLDELIAKTEGQKTLSVRSVNTIVEAISSMFVWAINEGLMDKNPARGLSITDPQSDIDKKKPLSREDIRHIFFDGNYNESNFKNPAYYWCPLIGLYTGMRLEEICQLHCEDIIEVGDLYVINITESSNDGLNDKELKNKSARRMIPIHPYLIKLGLIEYKDSILSSGHVRLFPLLNKTDKSKKYGKQVGKQFKNLLEKKNIAEGKSFHSLRHSFSNFFKKRDLHTDMFKQTFGHEIEHLAGKRYGERFTPEEIYKTLIGLIDYDVQET